MDDAMTAIERDYNTFKGVLLKNYALKNLTSRAQRTYDLVTQLALEIRGAAAKMSSAESTNISWSCLQMLKTYRGSQFYTPRSIVGFLSRCLNSTEAGFTTSAIAQADVCSGRKIHLNYDVHLENISVFG